MATMAEGLVQLTGDGAWLVASVVAVLVIAIAAARVVWPSFGSPDDDAVRDQAIERLRERYARGEIDEAEFERRRAYLEDT